MSVVGDDSIIVDGSSANSRVVSNVDDYDPDSQIDTTSVKIISGPKFGDAISNIDGTITYNYDESPIPFDTITHIVSVIMKDVKKLEKFIYMSKILEFLSISYQIILLQMVMISTTFS